MSGERAHSVWSRRLVSALLLSLLSIGPAGIPGSLRCVEAVNR